MFPVGENVVFESYVYHLGVFFDTEKFKNSVLCIFKKLSFLKLERAPTWAGPDLILDLSHFNHVQQQRRRGYLTNKPAMGQITSDDAICVDDGFSIEDDVLTPTQN